MDARYDPRKPEAALEPFARAYLLHGADDVLKDEAVAYLRSRLVDASFADFDYEALPGDSASAATVLVAACSAPFASQRRLVVVRDAEALGRRERQSEADTLAAGLASLGELSCLVLRVAAPPPDASRTKTVLSSRLDAAIRTAGRVVEFPAPSRDALIAWIEQVTIAQGKVIDPDAAARVLDASGSDRLMARNELEKVLAYVGERREVRVTDADEVCGRSQEEVIFRLLDAVSARQPDRTLRLFREMLRYEQKPHAAAARLLAMLSRQLRMLWQANELIAQRVDAGAAGKLPKELIDQLPSEVSLAAMAARGDWRVRKLFSAARAWDRNALATAMGRVVECDLANKGAEWGGEDVVGNLQVLLLRLCTEGRAPPARR